MYKKELSKVKFLIGVTTILFFLILYLQVVMISPFLRTPSLFYRNIIGSYLLFFIPINVISWLVLGQLGGMLIFIFSCFSIIFLVLRYAVFYYNIYIFLFGVAAFAGYRIFLNMNLFRNQCLADLETLEVDKNTLVSKARQKGVDIESFQNRVQRYAALKNITEVLSSTLDLKEIARIISEEAFNIIGRSDRVLLFLIDESKQELNLFASKGVEATAQIGGRKGEIFDSWILRQRRSLIIEDLDNDFRFSTAALKDKRDREFKSVLAVPLMSERKVIGVLRMDSGKRKTYSQDDLRLLGIISDLAAVSVENSMLYQKTGELAIRDGLTGLYVQRYFKERLNLELKKASTKEKKFSLLMIDLDYFKDYNDRYGHAAGDVILVKITQVLKANLGPEDIVSRYGGEEFAILLSGIDKTNAIKISEGIRKRVEGSSFTLRRDQVKMTVSIGISVFPDDGHAAEVLLKKADANLYKAKQSGRNMVWPTSF